VHTAKAIEPAWKYKTSCSILTVAIGNGYVVAGSFDYYIYCFDLSSVQASTSQIPTPPKPAQTPETQTAQTEIWHLALPIASALAIVVYTRKVMVKRRKRRIISRLERLMK